MTRGLQPDMRVRVAGLELPSPVIASSGTFGYGIEFDEILSLEKLGAFVTKGISREPMSGNSAPRLIETAAGMMNAIGLQNVGVETFLEKKLPDIRRLPTAAIVNIFGNSIEDYCEVIDRLNLGEGIAAYEINASCPNTAHGGMVFGTDPGLLYSLVAETKRRSSRPVIVKLSPNVTSIAHMAKTSQDAGADALSLVNTFLALSIDANTRRPRISNTTGGLSGPAIKPIALRMVWEAARAVTIPILGMGGITTAEDAVEFLLAGATAVQVGTASYADPRACERIATGLVQWCQQHAVANVSSLTGGLDLSR